MITNATAKSRPSARSRVQTPAARAVRRHLLPFMASFAVSLISGLFYYLVPHAWNWSASQIALWIHLVVGALGFYFLIPYVIFHHEKKNEPTLNIVFFWRAFRRREHESGWSYQQRIFGHILNWTLTLLGLSGFMLIIPSVLWVSGVVWMAGYPAYRIANLAHLGLALLASAFIGFHVARQRKRKRIHP